MKGGYRWRAVLADGSEVDQIDQDGQERSVDYLRTLAQPVRELHLIPRQPPCQGCGCTRHPYIRVDVGEGDDWIKLYETHVQEHYSAQHEKLGDTSFTIDRVGLRPQDGRTRKPTWLLVMPDGTLVLTTHREAF